LICDQPSGHGILDNVKAKAFEFGRIAAPTVIGFFLPKWLAGPPQYLVGYARGDAFQAVGEAAQWDIGRESHMNVIRHHYVCVQGVMTKFGIAPRDLLYDASRDAWILQPQRA
jgi:hypothetical protein